MNKLNHLARTQLKKKAKHTFKTHYFFYVALCLIAAFLSVEFTDTLAAVRSTPSENMVETTSKDWGVDLNDALEIAQQFHIAESDPSMDEKPVSFDNPILGTTNGVFASVVSSILSGSIFVTLVSTISSILGSTNVAVMLLVLASFVFFFMFWFYIQNLYPVLMRRMMMESRVYEQTPFSRFMYLSHIKKWSKAAWIMAVKTVLLSLWALTIIGGIIKRYSYYMVPYIVAENPNITARQAIDLSRRMMDGHKWDAFVLEISFIGWYLLNGLTFGLSNIFFLNPYKSATFNEYFTLLREEAIDQKIDGYTIFNDLYLYTKADGETIENAYGDVIDILNRPHVSLEIPHGFKGFLMQNFGILLMPNAREKAYEKDQFDRERVEDLIDQVNGQSYPVRLYTIGETTKRSSLANIHYIRHYTLTSLILMFFIFAFIGWIYEVALMLVTEGILVNRGSMHGPWLPIYGFGGILILTVLYRFRKNPKLEFGLAILLCGFLEYMTSYVMELSTGIRWWDYTGFFLNLNGRICAEGLLVFGVGGMAVVYVVAPLLDNVIMKFNHAKARIIAMVLTIVFMIDAIYSHFVPNVGEGITADTPSVSVEPSQS